MLRAFRFSLASLLAVFCMTLGACADADTSTSKPASTQGAGGAAGGGSPSGKPLTVGFSQIGAESAWRTAETKSVHDEAAKRGINLKFSDAQGNQANQIKALRSFVVQGVDAIILAPKEEQGWEPVLSEVKRANIPVILVDRGVSAPEDLYTTLIASDFVAEGRMVGEWLAKKLGGKASIAELQGTTGAAPANDRKRGFGEAIAKHPDMKIIMSQTGDFNRAGGKQVMEAFLKSPQGKQINAVYAHNDEMALGAIQAIEEAGLKPGKDVLVVSVDGGRAALEAVAEGKISCSVECSPRLGPMAFDAAQAAAGGQTLPKRQIVQDRLFDETNAKDVLARKDYWE